MIAETVRPHIKKVDLIKGVLIQSGMYYPLRWGHRATHPPFSFITMGANFSLESFFVKVPSSVVRIREGLKGTR